MQEEFMGRFARMGYQEALRHGRTSIQYKDVGESFVNYDDRSR